MRQPSLVRWASAVLALLPTVQAELRVSDDYAIEAESLDGGGGWSESADYSSAGSVESLVGGGSSSTSYALRHGFIASVVTLTSVSAYALWSQARGLVRGVNDGLDEDPNNDGIVNLQHFAFDTDPLGDGSDDGKRRLDLTSVGGSEYVVLTLPVRRGAIFGGVPLRSQVIDELSYEILGDSNLDNVWSIPVVELFPALDAGLPPLGDYDGVDGGDWEYRTFRLTAPFGSSRRQFMKAGVTVGP